MRDLVRGHQPRDDTKWDPEPTAEKKSKADEKPKERKVLVAGPKAWESGVLLRYGVNSRRGPVSEVVLNGKVSVVPSEWVRDWSPKGEGQTHQVHEAQTFEFLVAPRDDGLRNPVCGWGIFGDPSGEPTEGDRLDPKEKSSSSG